MAVAELTRISSKGQVVIPSKIRKELGLKEGETLAVFGANGTLVLKRIEVPDTQEMEELLKEGEEFARRRRIKRSDVAKAIRAHRARHGS